MNHLKKLGCKLCPECGQPMLKKGQKRKHPDDYRHARGCLREKDDKRTKPTTRKRKAAEPKTFSEYQRFGERTRAEARCLRCGGRTANKFCNGCAHSIAHNITRLIARWRQNAMDWTSDRAETLRKCSDQLEKLLKP